MTYADVPGDMPRMWHFAAAKGPRGRKFEGFPGPPPFRHLRGGPPFGGPMFGGPFGGGRGRRRRGDVRLALLLLLGEEPRNGYQLMQEIEARSGGRWRPSPGAVYPALSQLEDEGFVRATERDGSRVFEITDSGREHLAERGEEPPPWEDGEDAESRGELKRQLMQTVSAVMQVAKMGDEQQRAKVAELLAETRRAVYRLLADETDE